MHWVCQKLKSTLAHFIGSGNHWQRLVPYFNPTVVRSLITWFSVAPMFVRVLGDNAGPVEIGIGENTISVNLALPFSWWVLWFSSFLFIIAYVIYIYYCPTFIKRYSNYSEYKAHDHSPRYLVHELQRAFEQTSNLEKLACRLQTKGFSEAQDNTTLNDVLEIGPDTTNYYYIFKEQSLLVRIKSDESEVRQREIFWEIFEPMADSHQWARCATKILIYASIALGSYVTIQQIYFVVAYVISL